MSPSPRIAGVAGAPAATGGGYDDDAAACAGQMAGEPAGAAPHNNKTRF